MLGTAENASTRIVFNRTLVTAAVLAMLAVLVFAIPLASTAQAEEGAGEAPATTTTAPTPEASAESPSPGAGQPEPAAGDPLPPIPPAVEPIPPAVEPIPPAVEPIPPVVEPAPPSEPVVESAPPPPAPTPTPAPPASEPPVTEPIVTVTEAPVEKVLEPVHAKSEEKSTEGAGIPGAPGTQGGSGASTPQAGDASGSSVAGAPTGSVVINLAGTALDSGEQGAREHGAQPRPASSALVAVARSGCQLRTLERSQAVGCAIGWLGAPAALIGGPIGYPSVVGALGGAGSGGPDGAGTGGSTGGERPAPPTPGPAPGGASGGAAAGASGVGLSGFLTLAGLLLLAAPRAMRRLRLSCQPWLTAFFVLIPERPG
jgi:outer membrane biosynthesis protein TonB